MVRRHPRLFALSGFAGATRLVCALSLYLPLRLAGRASTFFCSSSYSCAGPYSLAHSPSFPSSPCRPAALLLSPFASHDVKAGPTCRLPSPQFRRSPADYQKSSGKRPADRPLRAPSRPLTFAQSLRLKSALIRTSRAQRPLELTLFWPSTFNRPHPKHSSLNLSAAVPKRPPPFGLSGSPAAPPPSVPPLRRMELSRSPPRKSGNEGVCTCART